MLEKAKPLSISEWTAKISRWKKEHPIMMEKKGMTPQLIIQSVNECFKEAVIATDVGQNQLWTTQFLEIDEKKQLLTSGGLGTMGYGFPAAIGAKLGNPHNHCCPEYTPDFVALAESYGAKGIRVTKAEEIKAALLYAKQNTKTPTVIEFIIDREINVLPIVPPGNPLDEMILESRE